MTVGMRRPGRGEYRVVVPVPALDAALPRFDAPHAVRRTLALAFAADTVRAAVRSRRAVEVVVATPDPVVASVATQLGARVLTDCQGDRMPVLAASAREAARDAGLRGPTAVLIGTLPSLLADELDAALAPRNAQRFEFVDLGAGTTTLWADAQGWPAPPQPLDPSDGAYRGWRPSTILPGLACDVGTIDGLRIAAYVGLGEATQAAVDALDLRLPEVHHAS